MQNPNFFGVIDDHADVAAMCHEHGALAVQSVYPVAQALLKTPVNRPDETLNPKTSVRPHRSP